MLCFFLVLSKVSSLKRWILWGPSSAYITCWAYANNLQRNIRLGMEASARNYSQSPVSSSPNLNKYLFVGYITRKGSKELCFIVTAVKRQVMTLSYTCGTFMEEPSFPGSIPFRLPGSVKF